MEFTFYSWRCKNVLGGMVTSIYPLHFKTASKIENYAGKKRRRKCGRRDRNLESARLGRN
jgi:hypothetical protein